MHSFINHILISIDFNRIFVELLKQSFLANYSSNIVLTIKLIPRHLSHYFWRLFCLCIDFIYI